MLKVGEYTKTAIRISHYLSGHVHYVRHESDKPVSI